MSVSINTGVAIGAFRFDRFGTPAYIRPQSILCRITAVVNTNELIRRFQEAFPGYAPSVLVRAPGRVNLIGEHTDYNEGFVLPIAMSQSLFVIAAPAPDGQIEVRSTGYPGESARFSAANPGGPDVPGLPGWSSYTRGVASLLTGRGTKMPAARLLIHSEVPIGGGVSSSAALETGSALALLTLAGATMPPLELALLCQQAEHQFAHSPCGIMDQFIVGLGKEFYALLLDCRSREVEQIPVPFDNAVLLVMNTQVKHEIGGGEYGIRRRQCEQAVEALKPRYPQIQSLRDVKSNMLFSQRSAMDPLIFRRAQHVVTEIERTTEAADALRHGRLADFGGLMYDSHASLKDDYQVSATELDALVDIAHTVPGVYGARMTGGGFGGCAIALVETKAVDALREAIAADYNNRFEKPALVYATVASDGARAQRL
jgi:galactokinase